MAGRSGRGGEKGGRGWIGVVRWSAVPVNNIRGRQDAIPGHERRLRGGGDASRLGEVVAREDLRSRPGARGSHRALTHRALVLLRAREERSVSLLFALVVSLCAATVAALFVTMWRDGDPVAAAALAFALRPVLILTIMAWRAAL